MLKRFVDFFRDPPPAQAPAPGAPQPRQASALADNDYSRERLPACGGPRRTSHGPLAETLRYRRGFENALMLGLDLPVLPHPGKPVDADRIALRTSALGAFVNTAMLYPITLGEEGAQAGRDPGSMMVTQQEQAGLNPMGTQTTPSLLTPTRKGHQ
ncbi:MULTISPECIES: hypothetical protein [unclassified Lysobacter]|uniref:hypothetical protein n=1 Tax=unclassified Lysobacter TaxID=2635362 RepID=UPI0006FCA9A1|nr:MULTISPECIES: hypothetical protein [unclassified Lysobacter]KRA17532.1 hypothetical protein ASD69_12675 [Lysobacter sp. Root604]KRD34835.1 hypothetical protein ASE35_08895 [Lysobacter sp. Root916]